MAIVKALQHPWIHCDDGMSVTKYMEYFTLIYGICHRNIEHNRGGRNRNSASQVYDIVTNFATSAIEYTRDALAGMPDDAQLLKTCATINQEIKKRIHFTDRLFSYLNRYWVRSELAEGKNNVFEVADLFSRDWNATALPYLRERMDRIAWRVRAGCHNEWKVNGKEWDMIQSFYGALDMHVTLTELGYREIFLCIRPVEFSMAQMQKFDRSSQSVGRILQRSVVQTERGDTEPRSRTDDGKPASKALIPAAVQHWSLVVRGDQGSMTWELEADRGNITIRKEEDSQVDLSDGFLVGYTSLTNDEISTNADAVEAHIGKDYNLANRNCQLLFLLLYESIRTCLAFADLFAGLGDLPSSLVIATTRRRCRELATTHFANFERQPASIVTQLPLLLGTLYLGALAGITVAILAYTATVAMWLSVMFSLYVLLLGIFMKGYFAVYLRMAMRLSDHDGYRFLHQAVYETMDDEYVRELIARRRLPAKIVQ